MSTFIKNLTSNWHMARWMRAAFSVVLFYTYFSNGDNFALLGAMLFGYQAIFNTGCCGTQSCATNTKPASRVIEVKEVERPKE